MIAPEELPVLLEAYRDGSLDREAAGRLVAELEAAGGQVMDDVEFGSLLHRALDTADGGKLVREFFAGMGIEVLRRTAAADIPAPARSAARAWRLGAWAAAAAAAVAAVAWLLLRTGPERDDRSGPQLVRDGGREAAPGASPVGELISGAVEVRPLGAKEFAAVPAGRRLLSGDTVRASASGPAEIDLLEKVLMVLDGGAEVTLAPDPALPCAVRLERGQVFAEVDKGAPFRVLAADGEVRSLGTRFAVGLLAPAEGAAGGGFAVSVEQGAVEVAARGEVARVESGGSLVLERGCPWRRESGECVRRRLGWVDEWRGCVRGRDGRCPGSGQRQGQGQGSGKGRGTHGEQRRGGAK